jgi:hypothetical protein
MASHRGFAGSIRRSTAAAEPGRTAPVDSIDRIGWQLIGRVTEAIDAMLRSRKKENL